MFAITRNGEIYDGRTYVGEVRACSIYDPEGASYVHIIKNKRERYGMPQDPYIIVFKRGDTWHAVGETQSNEEVDTVWGECGTTDLNEMLDKIRSID